MRLMRVLERTTRVAPFGVRFWDALTRSFVDDGLVVGTYAPSYPARRVQVLPNRAGVFVAHDLPGMRRLEMGAGDDAYWRSAPRTSFVFEVGDTLGRFLPFSFSADLPFRGLYAPPEASLAPPPGGPRDGLPLFSAPARVVPAGTAALHAELWDPGGVATPPGPAGALAGASAAGAVLTVEIAGEAPAHGIADAAGRVAILFPYPEPLDFPDIESPPATPPGPALTAQSWPITLSVRYTRGAQRPSPHPNLASLLAQRRGRLVADPGAGTAFRPPPLRFGEDLVLRSLPGAAGLAGTKLFVVPS